MPNCNNKQNGAGYGFTGNEPQFRGTYAMTGFSDCCPPTVETKNQRVNSISGILCGGAAHKKGGSYHHKLSKKLKKRLKKSANGLRKLSKTVLKKTRKVTKNLRKKLRGGSKKSDHRDPSERKFGCKQDKWTPDCI